MYNPYQLTGKTILVTGASSGIGRATAIECSKLGAKLIITARNEERLMATLNSLEGDGHQMFVADLTNQSDVDDLVDNIPDLDGLVNDAGSSVTKPIAFIKRKDLDNVFNINTFAPILLTASILKKKKMKKCSSIVMVSSIATKVIAPVNAIYGPSKSALTTFAEYCASEVKGKCIRVNSVLPGMVDTALTHEPPLSANERDIDREKYILKRYGKPEEIALAIAYLLSDATIWMTGSQLVIDGGVHL